MSMKLFISYCSEDLPFVDRLVSAIQQRLPDVEPLVVAYQKEPGAEFQDKVCSLMDKCKLFLTLLTRNSMHNQWVNQEIGYAQALHRRGIIQTIIPVVQRLYDETHTLQLLSLDGFIHKDTESAVYVEGEWDTSINSVIEYLGKVLEKGKIPESARLEQVVRILESDGSPWEARDNLQKLYVIYMGQQKWDDAIRVMTRSVELVDNGGWHWEAALDEGKLADLYIRLDQTGNAINAWRSRSDYYENSGNPWEAAQNMEKASKLLLQRNVTDKAIEFLNKAAEIYSASEYEVEATRCRKKIKKLTKPKN